MNKLIITVAAALSFAALSVHAETGLSAYEKTIAACDSNAGSMNTEERRACHVVAGETWTNVAKPGAFEHPVAKQIGYCKAAAGALNGDEKAGCFGAAIAQHTAYCVEAAGSSLMTDERNACVRVVAEEAAKAMGNAMPGLNAL